MDELKLFEIRCADHMLLVIFTCNSANPTSTKTAIFITIFVLHILQVMLLFLHLSRSLRHCDVAFYVNVKTC